MQDKGEQGTQVPEIRFGGFSEEWEEKRLGTVTESFSGGTPQVGIEEYYKGEIPFIRSAEINSSFTELFISEIGLKNSSAKMVDIGCILYALYGATSGEVGLSQINGAINQAILAILPNKETSAAFIMQWLRKNKPQIINTYLQGGQGNLSGTIVKGLIVNLPNTQEQTKIGDFFQQIDRLISQHQQKHDKLLNIKKALLEKMFPQPGKTEPEIRFQEFSGEWKVSNLKDLAEFNPKSELPENFKYVDLESVVDTDMISYRMESKTSAPSRAQRLAKQGDVFYQTVRPYQKNNYLFNKPDNDFVFSTGYAQMRPFEDSYFLLSLVQNSQFVKKVLDNCTGTSYPAINSKDLSYLEISFPEAKEQAKIGNLFQQLDRLINQHQTQIQKLNHLKQAFLSKMFV